MKRNIYKIILTGFLTVLLGISCSEDFLTKDPQGVVSAKLLADKEGIESLLIGAYAELDGVVTCSYESAGSNWLFGDVYADDAYKGSIYYEDISINSIEKYIQVAENYFYDCKWDAVYDGVSRTNEVLKVVNQALDNQTIKQSDAEQFRAEARFLRAYYHLEAIKMWDFIPYVDENDLFGFVENRVPSDIENNAGNVPWGQLGGDGYIPWDSVENDLQYAIGLLPEEPLNGYVGRAHKYAALAILAKTQLFQGKYPSALSLLNQIIESGKFMLEPNYHDNFRKEGNNNRESIFQIQASVNEGGTAIGYNGNLGDVLNFPYGGGPGQTYGFYQPTQNLVNAFKTTDGIIAGVNTGLPYLSAFNLDFNAEGNDVKNDEGISWSDPFTPDTRPLDPRLDWTVGRRGIPYLDWGPHPGEAWIRDQTYGGPYNSIKHVYYLAEEGTGSQGGWASGTSANNYSIVRYADVLLMAAECEVEAGSLGRARELVNEVRGRMVDHPEFWVKDDSLNNAANYTIARYPATGIPFDNQIDAREAVRFERRLELGLEGHRFWDLKRWGIAKSTLNAYLEREMTKRAYLEGVKFEDHNIRHPIPQDEIDISNHTLKQNPGY